ncbi:MAG TPA: adenylate/guanylate cyclase domain-containing protein [Candidatus Dormibacteraeota bacterium]|jgi:class 3 adenylate cyclase|nr:adenylate/guanylate cyclase domain-containing protein [Candidatus Dormibacteraeota bacterium]
MDREGSSAPSRSAERPGERRTLTILFADVVGSTAIAERMDPEDWTALIGEVLSAMNRAIARYDGTVARLMGDGVLAFFGAPRAHEDDPERAVRCGLEMVREIDGMAAGLRARYGAALRIRVGINTGHAVVGTVGSEVAHEYTAMGDAVNIAARMQAAADAGTVLISGATHRLIAPIVDATDRGALELKGKTEPVRAYAVSAIRGTLGAARGLAGVRSPMIGRDEELRRLEELFAVAQAGQGRWAAVLGEPGIGKSRLLAELRSRVSERAPAVAWIEGRCVSYAQSLPYQLVLDVVRSVVGVPPSASEAEIRDALEKATRAALGDRWVDAFAYLGHLFSITLEPELAARISALELETVKRYVASMHQLLRVRSAGGPLVMVCEDVHWSDTASADALVQLLPLLAEMPALCIVTSRVERASPGWRLITSMRELFGDALVEVALDPLSRDESRTLVANLLEIESLPAETRDLILAKSEGNPFFVEEVIRMLIDRGAIERRGERWVATSTAADIAIPDTLQALLLARIDRLPDPARRTLRIASVIGRQFGVRVLEHLAAPEATP